MLCLLETLTEFSDLKFGISDLKSQAEGVARPLRAWADALQNSSITGQRYLNEKTQKANKARVERQEVLEKLRRVREGKVKW